jgi:hypothetical protein
MLQQVVRIVTTLQRGVATPSLGNAVPNCPLTDTSDLFSPTVEKQQVQGVISNLAFRLREQRKNCGKHF